MVKHLIKKVSPALLNFTKWTARFWKPSRKYTRIFVVCVDNMTVFEMLETMHENDLFDMFPELCGIYIYIYPCSDTCYIVFCRTIIKCVAQIENLPPQHHGEATCQ